MGQRAYLFEAKGIQRYITAGGRLTDMAGASELVDELARPDGDDLLGRVMTASSFSPKMSRRAAAACACHFDDAALPSFERFRALWRLAVQMHAPGLEFEERFGAGATHLAALGEVYDSPAGIRENGVAELLPLAPPLARRVPRSGLAETASVRGPEGDLPLDMLAERKRARLDGATLAQRFGGKAAASWRWPVELDPESRHGERHFPHRGADRSIAVVHADVSGLGQVLRTLMQSLGRGPDDKVVEASRCFSGLVESAIRLAAQDAAGRYLVPDAGDPHQRSPSRPILLGGDDMTAIVRSDRALDFASAFLEGLESHSVAELAAFTRSTGIALGLSHLTACAGVAFVGASQPFSMAHDIADGLCRFAKDRVKQGLAPGAPVPSALAFIRVTVALPEERPEEAFMALELAEEGRRVHRLSAQPYSLGRVKSDRPAFETLRALREWMGRTTMGLSGLRKLRDLALADRSEADAAYRRWQEVLAMRPGGLKDEYAAALAGLGCRTDGLPLRSDGESPLFDALEWRAAAAA